MCCVDVCVKESSYERESGERKVSWSVFGGALLPPFGFFFWFLLPQKLFFINQLFLRASFVSFSQVRCFCFSRCASRRKEPWVTNSF